METQIGKMVTGDFQENTITFEIIGSDAVLQTGKYALVPIDDYNKLIGSDNIKTCCVFGCNNKADKGTLCNKHYLDK